MTQQEFQNRYRYNPTTDELGKGGFGSVYKAYDNVDDRWVAIKIAKVERDRENISLMNEVRTAQKLPNHTNIARYENCYRFDFPVGTYDHAVIQYYEMGNLSQLIKNKQLSLAEKEAIAKGVIAGIAHLHQHNIVHRDIKSSNVLIAQRPDGTYNPKIADFGLSKQFTETAKSYFSNSFAGGSLLYVAPEQLKGGQIRKNVDLWSMGVMLFELFTGQVPFYPTKDDGTETARKEIIQQIEAAQIPATINNIPLPWKKIIEQCLTADGTQRIKDTEAIWAIVNGLDDITIIDDPEPPKPKPEKDKTDKSQPPHSYLLIAGLRLRTWGIIFLGLALCIFAVIQVLKSIKNKQREELIALYTNGAVQQMKKLNYKKSFTYIDSLHMVQVSDKKSFDRLIEKARALEDKGDLEGARLSYIKAVSSMPDSLENYIPHFKFLKPPFASKDSLYLFYKNYTKQIYDGFKSYHPKEVYDYDDFANKFPFYQGLFTGHVFTIGISGFSIHRYLGKDLKTYTAVPLCKGDNCFNLSSLEEFSGYPLSSKKQLPFFDDGQYNTGNKNFNHYNPLIIRWFATHLMPQPEDIFYDNLTFQKAHDNRFYVFTRGLVKAYLFFQKKEGFYEQEIERYQKAVTKGEEMRNYLYNHYPDSGANISHTEKGFWLRRGIDGSHEEIWRALKKVMNMYDKEWFEKEQNK